MGKIKRALISVYDKSGVVDFAKQLQDDFNVEILSTGGTGRMLEKNGIKIIKVSEYTKSPEMFDGRVKTLHPRIEGGILMRQDLEKDINDAEKYDVPPIDMVVCNLYPFWDAIAKEGNTLRDNLEMIDIGGPTMIRAAAKNYPSVTVIADPTQYDAIIEEMKENDGQTTEAFRQKLAQHVFETMAIYDGTIAEYLSKQMQDEGFPEFLYRAYKKVQDCRYGENWDQNAAYFKDMNATVGLDSFKQLWGKKISFNNYLDIDACVQTLLDFGPENHCCSIFKHTTPNGIAIDFESQLEATKRALSCDPLSAFGGIYGYNEPVTTETADFLINDKNMFVEVIVAPGYEEDALEILKTKENMRILKLPNFFELKSNFYSRPEIRSTLGGALVQDYDTGDVVKEWKVVSKRPVSDSEKFALIFAYKACKWAKSNSAVFAKEYETGVYTLGIGAGQQSRVHVVKLAAQKGEEFGHDLKGSVMGTDSFFPFPDGLEAAVKAGAKAIMNPGGSIRDDMSIEKADELNVSLVFCGKRVFRH